MKITLDFRKTIEENAAEYFNKSKKAKKKIKGAKEALIKSRAKLKKAQEKELEVEETKVKKVKKREWFEKFHWFVSSDGFMVIGGRDSTTNEIIIKKYCDKDDLVLHTDMAGSPFVVIKSEGEKIPESTLQEAADYTAVFSKGWKKGLATLEVFWVKPEQVTKTTNSGESLGKGAFVITGKTNYLQPKMNYAVGINKEYNIVMGAPITATKKHCEKIVEIIQGDKKVSDVAKMVKKNIGGDLDEIVRSLPQGCNLKRERR